MFASNDMFLITNPYFWVVGYGYAEERGKIGS